LDPEKLQQALLNLLLNSIQAMPEGGTLRLEAHNVSGEESLLSRQGVRITISDTGSGIAVEDIPYIFDPFFTRNKSGCGLGLAIVHSIVQEHKGHISVSSQLGEGTTVRVDLPWEDGSAAAENATEKSDPARCKDSDARIAG
jgi:signal transduction histidine kinase